MRFGLARIWPHQVRKRTATNAAVRTGVGSSAIAVTPPPCQRGANHQALPTRRLLISTKEIEMFGMIESLAKAAVAVVTVPVAVVADVVTMGGVLTDKDQPYTADAVSDLVDNLKDATKPERR